MFKVGDVVQHMQQMFQHVHPAFDMKNYDPIYMHWEPYMGHLGMLNSLYFDLCNNYIFDAAMVINVIGLVVMALGCKEHSAGMILGGGFTAEIACWIIIIFILGC